MQGPALLPDELTHYESFATEEELFQALVKKPVDLIAFFELACADETWCEEHIKLIRSLLRWGAKSYYLSRLPLAYAQRMVKTVQQHLSILNSLLYFKAALFFTVTLTIEKQEKIVNSLMFGAASPYFAEIFKLHCFDRLRDDWTLHASLPLFKLVEEHILKGEIADLWRHTETEILQLMRQAKAWRLPKLIRECASILRRYINKNNVIDTLLQAHREFFVEWKEYCYQFFNQQGWGFRFLPGREADLRVEILNVNQETIELFDRIAPWVTHLTFSGYLSSHPLFGELLRRCPRLMGVDLTSSKHYVNQFIEIPATIQELNLSVCPWLTAVQLQQAGQRFLNLKELHLSSNVHLNYVAWGELSRFHHLETLHLARCHQLSEADLKLIAQACPRLIELDLKDSRGVTDQGLIEIIHACRQLTVLNISYCSNLSNKALSELALYAYSLTHLDLVHDLNFTDQGLLNLVQLRNTLKYLDVRECLFSFKTLEKMRNYYPLLELVI